MTRRYTLPQISLFARAAAKRKARELAEQAIATRAAHHAEQDAFRKFVASLDGKKEAPADALVRKLRGTPLWQNDQ